jgi:hypothetical protein
MDFDDYLRFQKNGPVRRIVLASARRRPPERRRVAGRIGLPRYRHVPTSRRPSRVGSFHPIVCQPGCTASGGTQSGSGINRKRDSAWT